MQRSMFVRNLRSSELFERFLVSAVSSLLLLRFYLHLTGYPQVGGGTLHIAHMLWGGALMLAAFVLNFAFLGIRIQRLSAIVGGMGFGIFIDEIGKFLTKDNNYFFRPSIGIIYAVFVVLYLLFNFLDRRQRLTSREYQLNALAQLEEAVLHDFDPHEKAAVADLLHKAEPDDFITKQLLKITNDTPLSKAEAPNVLERLTLTVRRGYRRLWQRRSSYVLIRLLFLVETGLFLLAVGWALYNNIDDVENFLAGKANYGQSLVMGQLVSTVIAAAFAALGAWQLRRSRSLALEYFRRATLVNLLLTEFFVFSRIQFGAMPGFIFNLLLLMVINFSIREGQHVGQ